MAGCEGVGTGISGLCLQVSTEGQRAKSQGRQTLGVSRGSVEAAVGDPGQAPCLQERAAEMWSLGCTVASKSMSQMRLVDYRQAEFWSKMTGR